MPDWGNCGELNNIDFDNVTYFLRSSDATEKDWDDVPDDIKRTFDRLGIPEAEQKWLGGVTAQYESEAVYHSIREDLEAQGVLFLDMDSGLKEYPEIVKEYFGTVIPYSDNKFSALNTAVWSGGSFIYVPKGFTSKCPFQAYFRINTQNMGQFERTLIIADEGSSIHYVEGCGADLLHRFTPLRCGRTHCHEGCEDSLLYHPKLVGQRVQPGLKRGSLTRTPPWNGWTATSARN